MPDLFPLKSAMGMEAVLLPMWNTPLLGFASAILFIIWKQVEYEAKCESTSETFFT